jgi:hypothetical protein
MFTLSPLTLMLAIASAGTTGLPNNTIKAAPAPHENISAIEPPGIIPVWRVGCFEHPKLNADDVNIAKQKLDTWGILKYDESSHPLQGFFFFFKSSLAFIGVRGHHCPSKK